MAIVFTETDDYPTELDTWITLPNGKRLHIRPLRPSEEATVRDLYARLSPRARYQRFHLAARDLPEALLRILVDVDYHRRLALVAESDANGERAVVGLVSFGAIDDDSAELGLVVRDDWQQQRLGTELAKRAMQAAEDRGFRRFVVHILHDNVAIRRLMTATGHILSATTSGGVTEIAFIRHKNAV
jgi:RimJ/RimL family protein N-acetyltransferase